MKPTITPDGLHTADYWRDCGEEARQKATEMRDPKAKQAMLTVAEMYDRMAARADARSVKTPANGRPAS